MGAGGGGGERGGGEVCVLKAPRTPPMRRSRSRLALVTPREYHESHGRGRGSLTDGTSPYSGAVREDTRPVGMVTASILGVFNFMKAIPIEIPLTSRSALSSILFSKRFWVVSACLLVNLLTNFGHYSCKGLALGAWTRYGFTARSTADTRLVHPCEDRGMARWRPSATSFCEYMY